MTTWLITGGAGYIGAHVVEEFLAAGIQPVVLDDLSTGQRRFVPSEVSLVEASVTDRDAVIKALNEHECTGVVHLAGFKFAGVSVSQPVHTYTQNVTGTASLLAAMEEAGVPNIVFSSSAAVYGTPKQDVVTEAHATQPASPYGESKLAAEWLIQAQGKALRAAGKEFRHTSLRYFNVVGSGRTRIRDISEHNLFPRLFEALIQGSTPAVYGTDYNTPDGSCVRDYLHVVDLARSHLVAAQALERKENLMPAYNLGSGEGISVLQIMATAREVTGIDFTPDINSRRPGDPAKIVATSTAAARDLKWLMDHNLEDMMKSAWEARLFDTE